MNLCYSHAVIIEYPFPSSIYPVEVLSMKLSIEAPENEVALPGEVHLHLRFRPANLTGIVLVILIHAVLLYFLLHMNHLLPKKQGDDASTPIELILNKMADASSQKAVKPEKARPLTPKPQPKPKQQRATPVPQPQPTTPTVPEPAPVKPPVAEAPATDMMAMVNAARERRKAAEAETSDNQAASSGQGMSAKDVVAANIRRSMQQAAGRDGTSGVFQILSKSTRVGSFSFRGWKPNSSSSWKQVIEVDAGLGGNIELAMVRRMIELIRTHYQGDFSWESHRLGRVVVLSARPQDSAELEAFLMKEFFG